VINKHHHIASASFSKRTLNKLAKANLFIVSSTWIPGTDGTFANGESAYLLSDGSLNSFLKVLELAA
jgi:hypothetical protein